MRGKSVDCREKVSVARGKDKGFVVHLCKVSHNSSSRLASGHMLPIAIGLASPLVFCNPQLEWVKLLCSAVLLCHEPVIWVIVNQLLTTWVTCNMYRILGFKTRFEVRFDVMFTAVFDVVSYIERRCTVMFTVMFNALLDLLTLCLSMLCSSSTLGNMEPMAVPETCKKILVLRVSWTPYA